MWLWFRAALILGMATVASQAEAQVGFVFVNRTTTTIAAVYASPSRAGDWGMKMNAAPIPAGAEVNLTPASPDCRQDLLVEFREGREESRVKVDICGGSRVSWGEPARPSDDPSFDFINGFGLPVVELYVAQSGQLTTTFDLLVTGPIQSRGHFWVAIPPGTGCLMDVAVVLADQTRREWSPIETCSVRDITFR